jgi:uncharacterized protein with ParB-like and HNH nuclease domain
MNEIDKLKREVESRKKEFITDSYSMSIGEIINLYKEKEIIINPDYQRFFRWTISQKSTFIESILLDIPIPPIFVYSDQDGKWEVVDGLQRISTILEFVGVLRSKDDESILIPPSKLIGTSILTHLHDMTWEKIPREPLQLNFKRTSLKMEIIKHESDPLAKFEVFQRLNSGGSLLTGQEFRNCILIMLNKEFYEWLEKLSTDRDFKECLALTDKLLDEKYDMELVLRFFLFPTYKFSQKEISEYLTEGSTDIASKALEGEFNYEENELLFRRTFKLLNELFSENVFKRYSNGQFKGKFLESLFEAVSIGVANNIGEYTNKETKEILKQKVTNIWNQTEFTSNMGSGTNTKVRVPKIVPFGIKYFKNG